MGRLRGRYSVFLEKTAEILKVKKALCDPFNMKDFNITHGHNGSINSDQCKHINEIIHHFDMESNYESYGRK